MNTVYEKVMNFKRRYPTTIAWRVKKHCKVVAEHINDDEEVLYAFAAQKSPNLFGFNSTYVVVLTDKRLILAQKRLLFGYFYYTITPDMFNDLTLKMGLIWGKAIVDTVKETVYLTCLSKGALKEIETVLSKYMMQEKRQYEAGVSEQENEMMKRELHDISKNGE